MWKGLAGDELAVSSQLAKQGICAFQYQKEGVKSLELFGATQQKVFWIFWCCHLFGSSIAPWAAAEA